jgi:hypothetical protein
VREGLREAGYDVLDLSDAGNGIPDLCVNRLDEIRSLPLFIEVKDGEKPPSQRRLTQAEQTWARYCGAITVTVLTLQGALEACKRHFGV